MWGQKLRRPRWFCPHLQWRRGGFTPTTFDARGALPLQTGGSCLQTRRKFVCINSLPHPPAPFPEGRGKILILICREASPPAPRVRGGCTPARGVGTRFSLCCANFAVAYMACNCTALYRGDFCKPCGCLRDIKLGRGGAGVGAKFSATHGCLQSACAPREAETISTNFTATCKANILAASSWFSAQTLRMP